MEKKQSTIAGRLRSLREERNMMQKEVAQFLRITPQAYSHYELGKRTPDIETLERLAGFFHVSSEYLILGKEVPSPTEIEIYGYLVCTFVNDVRPKKRRSLEEISSLLTKGGRSPTGVNKLGRTPNPAVFGLEISNQEPT